MKQSKEPTLIAAAEIDDRRRVSDRRYTPRRRILKAARLYWENGASSECIVRNLSETGAQLEISGPVPGTFDLVIANQLACTCCVVWRQGNRVGVKFQHPVQMIKVLPRSVLSAYRQYAEECRVLAKQASAPDRAILLNMASAWENVGRRYQRKSRTLPGD